MEKIENIYKIKYRLNWNIEGFLTWDDDEFVYNNITHKCKRLNNVIYQCIKNYKEFKDPLYDEIFIIHDIHDKNYIYVMNILKIKDKRLYKSLSNNVKKFNVLTEKYWIEKIVFQNKLNPDVLNEIMQFLNPSLPFQMFK